jgi:hypothetical protein
MTTLARGGIVPFAPSLKPAPIAVSDIGVDALTNATLVRTRGVLGSHHVQRQASSDQAGASTHTVTLHASDMKEAFKIRLIDSDSRFSSFSEAAQKVNAGYTDAIKAASLLSINSGKNVAVVEADVATYFLAPLIDDLAQQHVAPAKRYTATAATQEQAFQQLYGAERGKETFFRSGVSFLTKDGDEATSASKKVLGEVAAAHPMVKAMVTPDGVFDLRDGPVRAN